MNVIQALVIIILSPFALAALYAAVLLVIAIVKRIVGGERE